MKSRIVLAAALVMAAASTPRISAQEVLPFPPTPSASTAGLSMQDSIYKKRVQPIRLPKDAPNILIILMVLTAVESGGGGRPKMVALRGV